MRQKSNTPKHLKSLNLVARSGKRKYSHYCPCFNGLMSFQVPRIGRTPALKLKKVTYLKYPQKEASSGKERGEKNADPMALYLIHAGETNRYWEHQRER